MKHKKKIVMLGTNPATRGGIASVVQVYVEAGLFTRFPIHYIATHCDGSFMAKVVRMLAAYLELACMLATGRVGVLHIHVASRASFWRKYGLFQLGHLFGVPSILHLHGGEFAIFYQRECGPVRRWLIRRLYNRVSRVLVLSQSWLQWVRQISNNPHIEVVYNPVIVDDEESDWTQRGSATVLTLGRINHGKGSYDLLDAASRLLPQDFHLQFGGDGELKELRAAAVTLGLGDRIELPGWVGAKDKQHLLASAAIFVLPSYNEGLPMSLLEAMAAGLPVITTQVGGIPDAVTDGVEGFLMQPGDVAGLQQKLQLLLHDRELARRMGRAGRRKVETTFAASIVLPQIERIYLELDSAYAEQENCARS